MSRTHDLVIVGASFAGLVAARRAAEQGLDVLVLEKQRAPGATVHTTGILVAEAMAELEAQMAVPPALVRAVPGVRLYAPNLTHTDLASPGYAFYTTDTGGLLRHLAAEAEAAGATLRCNALFEGAVRDGNTILLPGLGENGADLRTRYLLGADGARSRVAEAFGLGVNRRFLVGLEVEYRGMDGVDPRFLHTFLDSRMAPGYIGWVAPGVGVTQVGLAAKRADKPNLARFEGRIGTLFDFAGAEVVERRSGVIPCGGLVRPVAAPRVLLVGDAAGMVSPATAGGIFTAFHWGHAAADGIAGFLAGRAPDPAATLPRAYPRFRVKSLLRRGLDLGPPNWLLNLMVGTPPMRALARLVYFHTKGLKSKAAWRDMVRPQARTGPGDGGHAP